MRAVVIVLLVIYATFGAGLVLSEIVMPDPESLVGHHYEEGLPFYVIVEPVAPKELDTTYFLCWQDSTDCLTIVDTTGRGIRSDSLGSYVMEDDRRHYLKVRISNRCWAKVGPGLWITTTVPRDTTNALTVTTNVGAVLLIEEPWMVPQDLNKDGEININDLTGLVRYLFGDSAR